MMTVVAIRGGLVPILWSTGTGSEIMQRIAVSMIGGMASSTALTLVVIPAIYALVTGLKLPRQQPPPEDLRERRREPVRAPESQLSPAADCADGSASAAAPRLKKDSVPFRTGFCR